MLHTEKEDFKNNVLKKITTNLKNDIQQISYYLEDDIKQIKKLLLFNLYVDNKINIVSNFSDEKDILPKFSYIFYATFIYYRIKTPIISYNDILNLYPINKNNFVCNLLNIDYEKLIFLINNIDDYLSLNKPMFASIYIKHPLHSNGGFNISIKNNYEDIFYTNCAENGILEFIKILFWDSTNNKFKINLPKEIDINTEPLKKLDDILNDININLIIQQKNIESLNKNQDYVDSLYKSQDYKEKILCVELH
jgi:hypothetical protein